MQTELTKADGMENALREIAAQASLKGGDWASDQAFSAIEFAEGRKDGAAEIARLREALRKVAIVSHHRMAEGGGTVPSGFSCEICDAECDQGQPLIHVGDCPLTVLNPQQ